MTTVLPTCIMNITRCYLCCTGARQPSALQQPVGPIYRRNNIAAPVEPQVKKLKANNDITAPEVRLVGADGSHQVLPLAQALQAARAAKLDLVEVAGATHPSLKLLLLELPVCCC